VKIKSKFFRENLQKYGWDCGVAAVSFLMAAKGKKTSRRILIKEFGASKDRGTDLIKIVKFFDNRPEFEASVKENSSLNWIGKELKKGRLVLVAYQNWQGDSDIGKPDWGHYGVILEIKKDKIRLFDPGETTGQTEFTKEDFEKRWYENDLGVHYDRWAMSLDLM
jgi:ABC-type bacteriocin/lantibiotic exporter with double-glycine peptidase domain